MTVKYRVDRCAFHFFLVSVVLIVFGYGVAVGNYRIFPYRWLGAAKKVLVDRLSNRRPHHLFPACYEYSGTRVHDANLMAPGATLLTSYWRELDWKPGIRLIDPVGNILHQWRIDPAEIWPTSPHTDIASRSENVLTYYVHGCFLFNNGDVIFNIEYLGLVRMNARGDIIWKLPYRTHHSIHRSDSGNFWVCGMKVIEDTQEGRERLAQYPGLTPPVAEDVALEVSSDGKVLREISILKALFESGYQQLIWQMKGNSCTGDILHTNDVEPLPFEMADQYALFDAGDILVSSCYTNSIFVIDPETKRIKWLSSTFLGQHDPDFIGNGWISVFDNNNDGSGNGRYLGGSRIVGIRPEDGVTRVLYPKNKKSFFYTQGGGKMQRLPNGNLLITEARRGRVFEVEESGRIVWEWVHERYDDELVSEVLEGTRYNLTPEQIAAWNSN